MNAYAFIHTHTRTQGLHDILCLFNGCRPRGIFLVQIFLLFSLLCHGMQAQPGQPIRISTRREQKEQKLMQFAVTATSAAAAVALSEKTNKMEEVK